MPSVSFEAIQKRKYFVLIGLFGQVRGVLMAFSTLPAWRGVPIGSILDTRPTSRVRISLGFAAGDDGSDGAGKPQ